MGISAELLAYNQAGEAINGEGGLPGEDDTLNRALKNLVTIFNTGLADTQVRRINFKITGAQEVQNGVVSDDVVYYNNLTSKYEKAVADNKNALGIIDVENLIIYSFGEYTLKNINTLVPGTAYFLHNANPGELVPFTDVANTSSTHVGVAVASNIIEINKFVDAELASVTINDNVSALNSVWSSSKVEAEIADKSKIYHFASTANNMSLSPNASNILSIPNNSLIFVNNDRIGYQKINNNSLGSTTNLVTAISNGNVSPTQINWDDVTNKPTFATVASTGSYTDLINQPAVATALVNGLMSSTDKSKLNGIEVNADLTPAGAVMAFAMSTPPTNWLALSGQPVSRVTYSRLFNAIGTTYGPGDGVNTFDLPDLRGEFVRGWDNGKGTDAGRAFGTNQDDELKSHNHDYSFRNTNASDVDDGEGAPYGPGTLQTGNTGGVETRPRNIALLYCIKT